MGSSKSLIDLLQPAKRLKLSPSSPSKPLTVVSRTTGDSNSTAITADQKQRIETNKLCAKAKRNIKACSDLVSKAKADGGTGYVRLEELLVEETWLEALPGELQKAYAKNLCKFVENEIQCGSVAIYPPQNLIFNALNSTPFDTVKAVIIGQDPYHGPSQAMGLSFSVPQGVKIPSSLANIFKELNKDLACSIPSHGNLQKWAFQGVLLLNTVLTVPCSGWVRSRSLECPPQEAPIESSDSVSGNLMNVRGGQANSHAKKGWEQLTDAVIKTISQKKEGVIFLLWGNSAREKSRLIDETKHHILTAAHPSGLSAHRGFFGCKHFSRTNQLLEQMGIPPIDWQL